MSKLTQATPRTDALVLSLADEPVRAAEKVTGEVAQLNVAVSTLYEVLLKVGNHARELERENMRLAGVIADIDTLRAKEGSCVTIWHDNPDFNSAHNCAVTVHRNDDDEQGHTYYGDTMAEALEAAVAGEGATA